MPRHLIIAALIASIPATGFAGSIEEPEILVVSAPLVAPATPDLIFTVRGGISAAPTYFGSDSYEVGPDFALGFQFLRLPGGRTIGSEDPNNVRYGLAPRGSLRIIKERSVADSPELAGLNDIDLSVELGFGLGYTAKNFEAFGVARYGVVGHEAWVAEFGADVIARPNDRLTPDRRSAPFPGRRQLCGNLFRRHAGRGSGKRRCVFRVHAVGRRADCRL